MASVKRYQESTNLARVDGLLQPTMLLSRQLRLSIASIPRSQSPVFPLITRRFATLPPLEEEEEQLVQARKWLSSFTPESLPRKSCEVTFSRSSGPGNTFSFQGSQSILGKGFRVGLGLIDAKVDRMSTSKSRSFIYLQEIKARLHKL